MPTSPDRLFAAVVRVNGSQDTELYQCIERITVNEDLDVGSSLNVALTICRNQDGSFPRIDDESLRPWNRVTIVAAFRDHSDVIIDAYISHVNVATDRQQGTMTVQIRGVDASYRLNLEEKCKVWTADSVSGGELTYEEIARTVLGTYKLRPVLPTTPATGGGPTPAVVQRGTDLRFLRELARRKGYEFYVRGGDAHFHPPDLTGTPQKLIAVNFGEETNCDTLTVNVDGTLPTRAVMSRIDPLTGQPETVTSTGSELPPLGTMTLDSLRGASSVPQTTVAVRRQGAGTRAQMQDYVNGLLRRHAWWVVARGTLDGLRYGRVLRSRKLVTIKGLGRVYNGNYYVRKVTHTLGPRSYSMQFEAGRNALGQLGNEPFTGERPDTAAVPVAAGAGADTDVVRVREDGPEVLPA
ncbi:MAG TPA: hypothetical protein VEW03_03885 [Longimicrobiaceae bacterium]|nr:hypothetical protein [Longimicrobiaceae bacterium]